MVTISGYSAIYFESMLKKSGEKITIWERNFQLAFYSLLLLIGIITTEFGSADEYIFFEGWTIHTILIATLQAGIHYFILFLIYYQ
jgi:UDP-sugar transporter A1/2/3